MSETNPIPQAVQPDLPALAPPIPAPDGLRVLSESEMQDLRRKLIEADGDDEKAGIDLPTLRNMIFTCRMKANPLQEAQESEGAAKPKRVRASSSSRSPTQTKLSGDDALNFLG